MSFKKIIAVSMALAHILMISLPSPAFAAEFSVFEQTYIREKGTPDTVEDTFIALSPNIEWTLRAVNGNLEDDEVEKVSSSTMILNGEEVLQPKQFNQNVNLIESEVFLNTNNTVQTTLKSKPGGQLTVSIIGEDNNSPTALWDAPLANQIFNNISVLAQVSLNDDISGLDPQSLIILLDGTTDVTDQFSPPLIQPTLAITLQADLDIVTEGSHTLKVQVSDLAGNQPVIANVPFIVSLDQDGDGFTPVQGDCDDDNADINPGATELCNAIDDNCDAQIDEGFFVGNACSDGVGECAANGNLICTGDDLGTVCDAATGDPSAEVCDGLDNNCDGVVDDAPIDIGTVCSSTGIGECVTGGVEQCVAGALTCDAVEGTPTAELCDTLDNDCDGTIDNSFDVGGACSAGVGTCEEAGTLQCAIDGTSACNAIPGTPTAEICDNGIDEDCNGSDLSCADVDQDMDGFTPNQGDCNDGDDSIFPGATEVCDGIDNDCNGEVDEDPSGGSVCVQLLSLDPIGDLIVDLGTSLALNLTASGGTPPFTFSASPLPLPDNAGLNATSGVFTFTPSGDQIGTIPLTFSVSDGIESDSETIDIMVEVPPGGGTSLSGQVLDANDFVQEVETPIVGATISLLNTAFSTTTDANGNFTLASIPSLSKSPTVTSFGPGPMKTLTMGTKPPNPLP